MFESKIGQTSDVRGGHLVKTASEPARDRRAGLGADDRTDGGTQIEGWRFQGCLDFPPPDAIPTRSHKRHSKPPMAVIALPDRGSAGSHKQAHIASYRHEHTAVRVLRPTHRVKIHMKYISAADAAELDRQLMSEEAGWSIDQLMELAGLSVACALHKLTEGRPCKVLVVAGPGNNGGDGLVAARHLKLFGYSVTVYFPKQKSGIYERLVKQLRALAIPVENSPDFSVAHGYDHVIDAIFGFSFSGEVRAPFDRIINDLSACRCPVLSVDAPSSWDIESGQPPKGDVGDKFYPAALISLSAPKPCSRKFQGRHFLGGRFLGDDFMRAYNLPPYRGTDQVVEISDS